MSDESTLEIGVCPFCGDVFEDTARCPDHDIPLEAPKAHLKRSRSDHPGALAARLVGEGKIWLLPAIALLGFGFFVAPLCVWNQQPRTAATLGTLFASHLWYFPLLMLTLAAMMLFFYETQAWRRVRFVPAALGAFGLGLLTYTAIRIRAGGGTLLNAAPFGERLSNESGFWLLGVGCLLAITCGLVPWRQRDKS